MSIRLKIVIAVLALGVSAFAVLGDGFFEGVLGLPPNSGRIVIAGVAVVAGLVWFLWSSISFRKILRPRASDKDKTKE